MKGVYIYIGFTKKERVKEKKDWYRGVIIMRHKVTSMRHGVQRRLDATDL